jgi:hypothetical protein
MYRTGKLPHREKQWQSSGQKTATSDQELFDKMTELHPHRAAN